MSGNTRYHRISEDMRQSMESLSPEVDAGLLLLDPTRRDDDDDTPPKKEIRFSCHPTLLFRLIAVCCFVPSFVLFIVRQQPRTIPAIVFVCFAFVRNIFVIIHYICSKQLRINFSIEFRNRSLVSAKPGRSCPGWLKKGIFHVILDIILVFVLLAVTIVINGDLRWLYGSDGVLAACILSYIGIVFYFVSIFDLGKPSNITTSGGIAFDYRNKDNNKPGQPPQVYRDVEAAGGLAVAESRKSGADSPVII